MQDLQNLAFENDWKQLPELEIFYEEGFITEVLHVVKSGKEATVYCCKAHPSTGKEFLAAKIYRPQRSRGFQNDAIYQEGRWRPGKRDTRAFDKKTRKGREFQFASWIGHEWATLNMLYEAGADVPKLYSQGSGVLLMDYYGAYQMPAPLLSSVTLEADEVQPLFDRTIHNIQLLLDCDRIHADLSAFNILYWNGEIKIIDFPQAVDPRQNTNAQAMLTRDVENVCRYWSRYGLVADPLAIAEEMWTRYRNPGLY